MTDEYRCWINRLNCTVSTSWMLYIIPFFRTNNINCNFPGAHVLVNKLNAITVSIFLDLIAFYSEYSLKLFFRLHKRGLSIPVLKYDTWGYEIILFLIYILFRTMRLVMKMITETIRSLSNRCPREINAVIRYDTF